MKFTKEEDRELGYSGQVNLIGTQRGLPGRSDLRLRTEEEMGISLPAEGTAWGGADGPEKGECEKLKKAILAGAESERAMGLGVAGRSRPTPGGAS